MKSLLIILLVCVLTHFTHAEESLIIPDGIRYHKTSSEANKGATQILKKLFSGKVTNQEVLSVFENNTLWCGPYLWRDIRKNEILSELKKGKVNISAPVIDHDGNISHMEKHEGKLFQSADEVLAFWKAFSEKTDFTDLKIRKLNPDELRIYWAMISWDITEPLFILESKKHKILASFTSSSELKITWIDDYQNISSTTEQSDAPAGYSWCEVPHVGVSVLKPNGWHVWEPELVDGTSYLFKMSRDKPTDGQFHTGYTMNIIPHIKKKSKVDPSTYAKHFISQKSKAGKVLEAFEMVELEKGMKRCGITIEHEMTIDGIKQSYVDHHTLFANDKTGTLYVIIFGTPSDKWDEDSKICNTMGHVQLNIHL